MEANLRDDSDDLVICPFDKTHKVRVSRIRYHVPKCEKNHPNVQIMRCPFNYSHYLHKHEYQQHVATCPDSALVLMDIMYSNAVKKLASDTPSENFSQPTCNYEYSSKETWEDDLIPNPTHFIFGQPKIRPSFPSSDEDCTSDAMSPLTPIVPSSKGIGRGRGVPMNAAAAKASGEPRRVNAPSLALFDLGISEPVGSADQQSTARASPNQMSPAMGVPPNQSLTATSTNQQAGGGPLRAPPGFDIANNVAKQSTGRQPMSQCITPSGIARDVVESATRPS